MFKVAHPWAVCSPHILKLVGGCNKVRILGCRAKPAHAAVQASIREYGASVCPSWRQATQFLLQIGT